MGVKHLWDIISPSCERRPLFELHGKTIAIDLSCWVVDSQSVTDNIAQPKMYLRNLYFRTVYLLMQDVSPVFVLEGEAPVLKHTEIARRNELRRVDESDKRAKKAGRTRFNTILKECETMLKYMGLKCIKGHGEAEAMCAYLNEDGLVDGCISQDSDCFLYGAKTVYRNFCTSVQGNRGGTGGSIDVYSMEKIERLFNLGRRKMIALALLCGCDYDKGVQGIGKEAALKLFQIVNDEDIIERIKSWRKDIKFKYMESKLKDPNICTSCGHSGKLRIHTKSGCADCGTVSKCNDSYKERKARMSHEISLRQKALLLEDFPNQELIDEFLVRKGPMPTSLDLQWKQPKIIDFVNFMVRHVCWEPEYAFAKIFPLMTRWQLRHFAPIPRENRLFMQGVMIPEKIKKIRNVRSVASYEIVWKDNDGVLDGLTLGKTSDKDNDSDETDTNNEPEELVSIEPQDAVLRCYPELVEEFEAARQAKKKKPVKPREKKKKTAPVGNEDPSAVAKEPKKKTAVRRPRKKAVEMNNRKIDEFAQVLPAPSLEDSFEAMSIAPKRRRPTALESSEKCIMSGTPKRGPQFDRVMETERISSVLDGTLGRMFDELTPEDFPSEIDDYSIMGDVIEELCNPRPTQKMDIVDLTLDDLNNEEDDEHEMEDAIERLCSKSISKGTIIHSFEKDFASGKDEEAEIEEAIERLCNKSSDKETTKGGSEENFETERDEEREIEEAIKRLCRNSMSRETRIQSFEYDSDFEKEDQRKIEESTEKLSNCSKRRSKSCVAEQLLRSFERHASDEETTEANKKKKSFSENRFDRTQTTKPHEIFDESDDFDLIYVPLSQRIKPSEAPNSQRNNVKTSKKISLGVDDLMCDSD